MPLFLMLNHYDAQMQLCHTYTEPETLKEAIGWAEVVVSACGRPNKIRPEWLREGAIVIDVGITYLDTK